MLRMLAVWRGSGKDKLMMLRRGLAGLGKK